MTTLEFTNELVYSGRKARVAVRLSTASPPIRIDMVLDSGAEVSVINRDFAAPLGISDVTTGEAIELIVANQDSRPAWIHQIPIEVMGRSMMIEAAFCPDWDMANLLGLRGFFDQLVVAFDHANRRLYV
ncbi:MAG: hypothetical protein M3P30_04985 [Chloroflexota bacterium]|nr:hypothetical protein [Chloroflexota bacterium]